MRETFKDNNMEFSNVELKGGTSDHRSFENVGIPNIYIGQDNINIRNTNVLKAGKISLNNKSKISDKLTKAMRETFKDNNMEFSNVELKGGTSDHRSFENVGIPNVYIGQDNIKPYIHNPNDTPDALDFDEIEKVAAIVSEFVELNDGKSF